MSNSAYNIYIDASDFNYEEMLCVRSAMDIIISNINESSSMPGLVLSNIGMPEGRPFVAINNHGEWCCATIHMVSGDKYKHINLTELETIAGHYGSQAERRAKLAKFDVLVGKASSHIEPVIKKYID